jgi:hypothetical protein
MRGSNRGGGGSSPRPQSASSSRRSLGGQSVTESVLEANLELERENAQLRAALVSVLGTQ